MYNKIFKKLGGDRVVQKDVVLYMCNCFIFLQVTNVSMSSVDIQYETMTDSQSPNVYCRLCLVNLSVGNVIPE